MMPHLSNNPCSGTKVSNRMLSGGTSGNAMNDTNIVNHQPLPHPHPPPHPPPHPNQIPHHPSQQNHHHHPQPPYQHHPSASYYGHHLLPPPPLPNRSWRNIHDKQRRKQVMKQIIKHLHDEIKISALAQRYEKLMYQTAASLDEYSDHTTISWRVRSLIQLQSPHLLYHHHHHHHHHQPLEEPLHNSNPNHHGHHPRHHHHQYHPQPQSYNPPPQQQQRQHSASPVPPATSAPATSFNIVGSQQEHQYYNPATPPPPQPILRRQSSPNDPLPLKSCFEITDRFDKNNNKRKVVFSDDDEDDPNSSNARSPAKRSKEAEQEQGKDAPSTLSASFSALRKPQRLVELRHAAICKHDSNKTETGTTSTNAGATTTSCSSPYCSLLKTLWNHLGSCTNNQCKFPHCYSSRILLGHHSQCKKLTCSVCCLVRGDTDCSSNSSDQSSSSSNHDGGIVSSTGKHTSKVNATPTTSNPSYNAGPIIPSTTAYHQSQSIDGKPLDVIPEHNSNNDQECPYNVHHSASDFQHHHFNNSNTNFNSPGSNNVDGNFSDFESLISLDDEDIDYGASNTIATNNDFSNNATTTSGNNRQDDDEPICITAMTAKAFNKTSNPNTSTSSHNDTQSGLFTPRTTNTSSSIVSGTAKDRISSKTTAIGMNLTTSSTTITAQTIVTPVMEV